MITLIPEADYVPTWIVLVFYACDVHERSEGDAHAGWYHVAPICSPQEPRAPLKPCNYPGCRRTATCRFSADQDTDPPWGGR